MKTPEEMAEEYADLCVSDTYYAPLKAGFLAGYQAHEKKEKLKLAELYSHGSEVQQIAAQYVKQRGTTGPMAAYEENRFIDGYQAGRLDSEGVQAAKPQWISVKERLPEYDQFVLLWHPDFKRQFVGCRVDSGIIDPLYWWKLELDMHEPDRIITHWMPLPEAPKEEK